MHVLSEAIGDVAGIVRILRRGERNVDQIIPELRFVWVCLRKVFSEILPSWFVQDFSEPLTVGEIYPDVFDSCRLLRILAHRFFLRVWRDFQFLLLFLKFTEVCWQDQTLAFLKRKLGLKVETFAEHFFPRERQGMIRQMVHWRRILNSLPTWRYFFWTELSLGFFGWVVYRGERF